MTDQPIAVPRVDRLAPWLVLGLVLFLAAVTGPRVFGAPLWGDEFRTWRDGIEKPLSDVLLWKHNPDHAPLGHLMARAGAAVFGVDHAWALRLGAWLCGLACVPALWWMGRTLWASSVGVLMALMFCVDPNIGFQMTQARMYSPLMLAAIVALGLAGSLTLDPTRPLKRVIGLGVAVALGIWSHGSVFAVVLALLVVGVALAITRTHRRAGVVVLIGLAVGCALGAQGVAKIIGRHDAEAVVAGDITGTPAQQLGEAVKRLAGGDPPAGIVVAASIAGVVMLCRRPSHRPVAALVVAVVVITIVNLFIAVRYRPIAQPRYLTVLQPPLWLAMGVLVVELWRSPYRKTLGVAGAITLAVLSVHGFRNLLDTQDADATAQPLAKGCRLIRAQMQPGDRFAVVQRSPYGMYTRYYGLALDDPLDDWLTATSKPREARERTRRADLGRGTIWLLCIRPNAKLSRSPTDDPASVVRTIAAARGIDPGPLDDLTRPKGWRAAVVRIDATKAEIVQSWNRDD